MIKKCLIVLSIILVSLFTTFIIYQLTSINVYDIRNKRIKKDILKTDSIVVAKLIEENDVLTSNTEKLSDDESYYIKSKITNKEELDEILKVIVDGEIKDDRGRIITTGKSLYKIIFMRGEKRIATFYVPFNNFSVKNVGDVKFSSDVIIEIYEKLEITY